MAAIPSSAECSHDHQSFCRARTCRGNVDCIDRVAGAAGRLSWVHIGQLGVLGIECVLPQGCRAPQATQGAHHAASGACTGVPGRRGFLAGCEVCLVARSTRFWRFGSMRALAMPGARSAASTRTNGVEASPSAGWLPTPPCSSSSSSLPLASSQSASLSMPAAGALSVRAISVRASLCLVIQKQADAGRCYGRCWPANKGATSKPGMHARRRGALRGPGLALGGGLDVRIGQQHDDLDAQRHRAPLLGVCTGAGARADAPLRVQPLALDLRASGRGAQVVACANMCV